MVALFSGSKTDGHREKGSAQRRFFLDNGFLVLSGFFSQARIAALKAHIDSLWERRREPANPLVIDSYFGLPEGRREFFRVANDDVREHPYKLLDLYLEDAVFQQFSADPRLMDVIEELLLFVPVVINSLLFEYGSQQDPHFDTFYMPSRTANLMTASWIAIDPVTETNGPLVYYPGSHLIPPFRFSDGSLSPPSREEMHQAEAHIQDIIKKSGVQQKILLAQPGDVLIWHAQLLHGGAPILNHSEKRTSLVTHYWTTTDLTDASDLAMLGPNQLLLKRPHHHVVDPANPPPVDEVLKALNTPPADRGGVPPEFDARSYLLKNPDILAARADPYTHYLRHGRSEGRAW